MARTVVFNPKDDGTIEVTSLDGEFISYVVPAGTEPPPPNDSAGWTNFVPQLRVGASGGKYAGLGNGLASGGYKTRPTFLGNTPVIEVELFVDMTMINPTIPDGEGFEIEVPPGIQPTEANWSRGGGGDLWIMGGSNSHSISPKWTDRNDRGMRILILGSGWEWTTNVPKAIPVKDTEKSMALFFWMKYLKQV